MKNILGNIYKKKLTESKKKIYLGFFWLLCFAALNLNPEEINNMNSTQLLRIASPLVLILFFFIYNFNYKIIFFQKINVNFYLFITYFFLLIFFTLWNVNINSFLNIYWGLLMVVPILYIFVFQNDSDQLKFFLLLSLLLLFSIFSYYFLKIVINMILLKKVIHLYGISDPNFFSITNEISPRSSGLSRMAIIIYISLSCYLVTVRRKFYVKSSACFFAIIIGTIGLLFQSRTMNFIFLIFTILLTLIYFNRKSLINRKFIFFLIITPIILTNIYNYYAFQNTSDPQYLKYYDNHYNSEKNFNLFDKSKNIAKNSIIRESDENFSSNRFDIWRKTIEISKKNILIGYGFQSDRKLINESTHNVYLYSLICGGLISALLIILISLRGAWVSLMIIINFLFLKKNYDSLALISAFLVPLFLQRGTLENSYGIYSIDFLFFIICFFINEINYKKKLFI